MATATEDRDTTTRDGKFFRDVSVAAAQNLPSGTVGAIEATNGRAGLPSSATYSVVLGVIEDGLDNTSGANDAGTINIRRDIAVLFANDGVAPCTAAHVGGIPKWRDNQTAAAPATASLAAGGKILSVTSEGVWVYFP